MDYWPVVIRLLSAGFSYSEISELSHQEVTNILAFLIAQQEIREEDAR